MSFMVGKSHSSTTVTNAPTLQVQQWGFAHFIEEGCKLIPRTLVEGEAAAMENAKKALGNGGCESLF